LDRYKSKLNIYTVNFNVDPFPHQVLSVVEFIGVTNMTKKTYEEQNTNFMPNKALQLYKQTEAHDLSEFLHCLVLAQFRS
jgi:hypothetical protein